MCFRDFRRMRGRVREYFFYGGLRWNEENNSYFYGKMWGMGLELGCDVLDFKNYCFYLKILFYGRITYKYKS